MTAVTLRPATAEDAGALTRLTVRSKASHGYDAGTMAAFAPALVFDAGRVGRDWVLVAEEGEVLLGFVAVEPVDADGVAWLEDLFVDPGAQGRGLGRRLWEAAVAHARAAGATELRFDADPHAEAFYRRLGAETVGTTPSTLIPGRTMPRMRFVLAPAPSPSL